ncbi:hypothetical protein FIM10_18625 [Sphingomonadales bacterium 56]|uniref:Uncharacterized protein n=1 Tax=Sphingobium indicum TaxID=332055 RepID=A0A4Q4ITL5_9SPHN|nr:MULTISPECIES: hypothetical protein [Sphingobium]MBY2930698.1 hypothetical protein [Sphingomonadales bacterium 56]MBY2960760.1 hypothetical protein [Sphingomonadales bacterium 58]NYI25002.1 hypothetical protein [Sphingobium indicum]RYL96722.1 hypothetical protein EWH08_19575 [Sphingobium indicum]
MLELFDLEALVARHGGDPDIAALGPLIRSAISMSSVRNDLKRAAEMIAACKALSDAIRAAADAGQGPARNEAATLQALFAQAVLLYTRATHSTGAARNRLQITNHLSGELRMLHDRATRLRDSYLAHFGDPSGWEEHRCVLALDIAETRMALSYPHASAYLRPDDARDFERLLTAALPIAYAQSDKVSTRLNAALNQLFETRPAFLELLRASPFVPETFFDPDEIASYLASVGAHETDPETQPRLR